MPNTVRRRVPAFPFRGSRFHVQGPRLNAAANRHTPRRRVYPPSEGAPSLSFYSVFGFGNLVKSKDTVKVMGFGFQLLGLLT